MDFDHAVYKYVYVLFDGRNYGVFGPPMCHIEDEHPPHPLEGSSEGHGEKILIPACKN
jgi:hypothetical protein